MTVAVSFKADIQPKRFFFLALFLLIAFSSFPIFSALLAVPSQYHGEFYFVKRFLKKYFLASVYADAFFII